MARAKQHCAEPPEGHRLPDEDADVPSAKASGAGVRHYDHDVHQERVALLRRKEAFASAPLANVGWCLLFGTFWLQALTPTGVSGILRADPLQEAGLLQWNHSFWPFL